MGQVVGAVVGGLAVFAATSVAWGDVIQLTLGGQVSGSNMSAFPVGQNVTVVLTYESAGSPQSIQNSQAFYVNHFRSFSMNSGGYSTSHTGAFGQINKYNNLSGFDGISLQAARLAGHYQFTSGAQTVPLSSVFSDSVTMTLDNVIMNLASNSSTVWSDFDLPVSYNFAQFDQTRNMVFHWSGGSFMVGLSTMEYVNTTLPTPGVCAVLGLGGLSLARRRR